MPYKLQTIQLTTYFQPFEYRTSSLFRSPLYCFEKDKMEEGELNFECSLSLPPSFTPSLLRAFSFDKTQLKFVHWCAIFHNAPKGWVIC